ncbi:MAG: hypothetical protein F6K31_32005 [Symploca sp. SIO2G7]|nr:hypothetical protein [Symploca sp. SIO2G7]
MSDRTAKYPRLLLPVCRIITGLIKTSGISRDIEGYRAIARQNIPYFF